MKAAVAAVLIGASFLLVSCGGRRADASAPPPTPVAEPSPALPPAPEGPVSEPQTRAQLPPPQGIPDGAAQPPGPPLPPFREPVPVADQPPVEVSRMPRPALPAPSPAAGAEPSPSPAAPRLAPLLSEAEKQEYNRIINDNIQQTRRNLELVASRRLDEEERAAVKRIRAFLRQAEDSRIHDFALARSLSERAHLLAEDLVQNSR